MVTKFVRPKDSLFPLIYHTFKAKSLDGDELVEYYIQDLTESHYEKAVELLIKNFMPEESFQMAINLAGTDYAAEVYKIYFTAAFQERCSLGCFVSGTHVLVGVDVMTVKSKGEEEEFKVEIEELILLQNALNYVKGKCDYFTHFNIDYLLYGMALSVHSDYRRRGIATELLKARDHFLRVLNLTVTGDLFTVIGSQKAAALAGYKHFNTTSFAEVQEKFPKMDFSRANTPYCTDLYHQIE